MRILIVSDIHANFVALETVLSAASTYNEIWCLGDTIGYGPMPNECAAAMVEQATIAISGNHDLACIGKIDLEDFNPDARRANIWNGNQLIPEHRTWLEGLTPIQQVDERFTVAHGSPREPVWEYLLTAEQAIENFEQFSTQVCWIGHSHVQLAFRRDASGHCDSLRPDDREERNVLYLDESARFLINPGSVGQPRDYDRRAAFAILDTETKTVEFHRVEYDIGLTQQQMHAVGLPIPLIRRLEFGI